MKQIALLLPISLLLLIGQSCQSGSDADSSDSNGLFSKKPKNEFTRVDEGPVYSFTVVPEQYENCRAVFAQSEEELTSGNFIFATDMQESCVLAIDGRLIQVNLRSKQTSNPNAQFYKFEGNGFRIDLEIRQTEEVSQNLKKARAHLKIYSQAGFRDIYYVMGEIKC